MVAAKIKTHLTINEMRQFSESVADSCWLENGIFAPWMKDVAILINTVAFYTDIELSGQFDMDYGFCNENIIDLICGVEGFDRRQYNALLLSTEDLISYRKNAILNFSINSNTEVAKLSASICETIDFIRERLATFFKPDMVKHLLEEFSNDLLDPRKLVAEVIEQMPKLKSESA